MKSSLPTGQAGMTQATHGGIIITCEIPSRPSVRDKL
jgi:hypothetical protein